MKLEVSARPVALFMHVFRLKKVNAELRAQRDVVQDAYDGVINDRLEVAHYLVYYLVLSLGNLISP